MLIIAMIHNLLLCINCSDDDSRGDDGDRVVMA